MAIITRKEYMANSSELHRAYYAQFITPRVRANVAVLDLEKLRHDFNIEDTLGDITKKHYSLAVWDRMSGGNAALMLECGDYMTKASSVCIHKEAARQRLEAGEQK